MQLQYWKYKRYTFGFYIPLSTVKMWKKSFLKFQRFQSFSTVNAEDGLWKSENLFTFISFGTGIWILIFNWELMLY